MSRKSKSEPEIVIPTLAETSAEYARLEVRRAEILARLQAIADERRMTAAQRAAQAQQAQHDRVAAIVAGENRPAEVVDHDGVLARLRAEEADLREAAHLVEVALGAERLRASQQICAGILETYRERAIAVCRALAGVQIAMEQVEAIDDRLRIQNIASGGLPVLHDRDLGSASDRNNLIGCFLKRARAIGLIATGDIPEALR